MSEREVKNKDQFIQRWPRWRYRRRGFTWQTRPRPCCLLLNAQSNANSWHSAGKTVDAIASACNQRLKKGRAAEKESQCRLREADEDERGVWVDTWGGRRWSRGAERGTPLQC